MPIGGAARQKEQVIKRRKKDDWRRFLMPWMERRDGWLSHQLEGKEERGREPSIAELRMHAHEAVDEALNWVEDRWAEERAEKVVRLYPARHESTRRCEQRAA